MRQLLFTIATGMAALALAESPVFAQDDPEQTAQAGTPPQRIRSVILYGEDKCPPAQGDEIVVCAREGDSPFRLPERFRQGPPDVARQSWSRQVENLERVNRVGLPNSCSPVGTGGQTGCTGGLVERWAMERAEQKSREAGIP